FHVTGVQTCALPIGPLEQQQAGKDRYQGFQQEYGGNAANRNRPFQDAPGLNDKAPRVVEKNKAGGDQQKEAAQEVNKGARPPAGIAVEDVDADMPILQEGIACPGHEEIGRA